MRPVQLLIVFFRKIDKKSLLVLALQIVVTHKPADGGNSGGQKKEVAATVLSEH